MKKWAIILIISATVYACGGDKSETNQSEPSTESETSEPKESTSGNPSYDPNRGVGKFTKVEIPATLDKSLAANGEKVYAVKCSGCHKLTDEKLVGPGWKGVINRHSPEWIMNFSTNTAEMLDKDPKAQAQLEICLVRMPNQNLADEEARSVYEFMRKNDGVQ